VELEDYQRTTRRPTAGILTPICWADADLHTVW